jgi:hypothetical protein
MTVQEIGATQREKLRMSLEIKDAILRNTSVPTILQALCVITRANVTPKQFSRFAAKRFCVSKVEKIYVGLVLRFGDDFQIQIGDKTLRYIPSASYFKLYLDNTKHDPCYLQDDQASFLLLRAFGKELEEKLYGLDIDESRIIER